LNLTYKSEEIRMRHTYSLDFKCEVIKQALEIKPLSLVARKYKLNTIIVSRWVREYKQGNIDFQKN
jgi:transposase-like protein